MTVPSINDVRKKWSIFRLLPQVHNHLNLGYFSPHCAKRTYEFQYKIKPISSTFFTSFKLLDTRTSGCVLWIWLRPFIHPSATQDFRIGLSFFFLFFGLKVREVGFVASVPPGREGPKCATKSNPWQRSDQFIYNFFTWIWNY